MWTVACDAAIEYGCVVCRGMWCVCVSVNVLHCDLPSFCLFCFLGRGGGESRSTLYI